MRNQKPGTYNKMRKFSIKEISAVPAGAMGEGSNMAIIKRAEFNKKHALTDPMDGHTHTLTSIDDATIGETSFGGGHEGGMGHTHPWIVGINGEIIVGAADGHTHRVGFFSKTDVLDETHTTLEQLSASSEPSDPADNPQEETMTETEFNEKLAELQKSLDEATARAERAELVAKMSDVQKAFHSTLEGDAAEDFLKSDSKDAVIKNAQDENPIVGEFEGREIRKNDDPTGVITALIEKAAKDKKDFLDLKAKGDKEKEEAKKADLLKRANELDHLPGDVNVKAEMLKSLDSIEDDSVRTAALEVLVAKNAANAGAFETMGSLGEPEAGTYEDSLNRMAKSIHEKNPGLTYEQAYVKAAESPEGLAEFSKREAV